MSIKTSIYINDKNEEFLNLITKKETESLSGNIGHIISGYRLFIRQAIQSALPKLGDEEWVLILQAFNGTVFGDDNRASMFRIASLVADDLGIENFMNIADQDIKTSLEKIISLTKLEEMAVIEATRMFWINTKPAEGEGLSGAIKGLVDQL